MNQAPAGRITAVDFCKFLVLFLMVQGHLFRAYLDPGFKQAKWFFYHELVHGWVAPAFLFMAGFVAYLAHFRRHDQTSLLSWVALKRLGRILFLLVLGYWLHLPFFSLKKSLAYLQAGKGDSFFQVNILQCIAVSLLVFTLLARLIRGKTLLVAVSALLALFFFIGRPWIGSIEVNRLVDAYFNPGLSYFPLFPWAGFLFCGVAAAWFHEKMTRSFFLFTTVGGLLLILPLLAEKNWSAGVMTASRLGGILLLFSISSVLSMISTRRISDFISAVAAESLFIYVSHLLVIFGFFMHPGLRPHFSQSLNPLEALSLFLLLETVILLVAWVYHLVKTRHPVLWRLAFMLSWAVFLWRFIVRPY